jgi:hypothetical protein
MSRGSLGRGLAAVVSVLAFVVVVSPAAASHVQCGDVITQDTTLDSDLFCTGDGLTVAGSGVRLDLAGHAIQGAGAGVGISAQADATDVSGGTIRGFSRGVDADGPSGLLVHDMVLEQNGTGVRCTYSPGCSVLDSTVRHNRSGIGLSSPDGGSPQRSFVGRNRIHDNDVGLSVTEYLVTVTDNRIVQNRGMGVEIDYNGRVDMSRNLVARNGGDGIVVSFLSRAAISNNRIERNGGNGVSVIGDLFFKDTRADVRGNRILRNAGDGVLVEAEGAHAVVERNRTERNGDDGIDVDLAATTSPDEVDTLVRANRAYFNADLGIEAAPGTTDGGANRARHNGNPVQCTGGRCE